MKIEEALKTSFRNDLEKTAINLFFTRNWLMQFHKRKLRHHDLTLQQFYILRILNDRNPHPASIGTIKERMLENESDVSRVVDKMKRKDLVRRTNSDKDRRKVLVHITEKGKKSLERLSELDEYFDNLFGNLTKKEIKSLNKLLDKLRT